MSEPVPVTTRMVFREGRTRQSAFVLAPWRAAAGIFPSGWLVTLIWATCLLVTREAVHGQPLGRVRWQVMGDDCGFQVARHRRLTDLRPGLSCDLLQARAGRGTYAYMATPIPPTVVIPELQITQELRSSQAGLQLLIRVVLPRTSDEETGQPVTVVLAGGTYEVPNTWQRLALSNIDAALADKVRILRSETRRPVDAREAFVDLVVVNTYGRSGSSDVALRDPIVEGSTRSLVATRSTGVAATFASHPHREIDGPRPRVLGDTFVVQGRPFFPRAIDARGEEWTFLKELGFNTIRLAQPVSQEHVLEAERLGLWLIAPPPERWSSGENSWLYRRVLAWNLGEVDQPEQLRRVAAAAAKVRAASAFAGRPLIVQADAYPAACADHVDLLLLHSDPLHGHVSLRKYYRWLTDSRHRTPAGTVTWATVQNQPLPVVEAQLRGFGYDMHESPFCVEPQELEAHALLAATTGQRGLVFPSYRRLDLDDDATRLRVAQLRHLNQRLQWIEPWLAAGETVCLDTANRDDFLVTAIRTDRAWLIVALFVGDDSSTSSTDLPVTVPGASESCDAFELLPDGLRRMEQQRSPGGVRLHFATGKHTLAILSRESIVIANLERRVQQSTGVMAELTTQIGEDLLRRTRRLAELLSGADRMVVEGELRQVAQDLSACRSLAANGEFARMQDLATATVTQLSRARKRIHRSTRHAADRSPMNEYVDGLPLQASFISRTVTAGGPVNLLPVGDFESERVFGENGWQVYQDSHAQVVISIVSGGHPAATGRQCLRMSAAADASGPSSNATPRLAWLESPSIPVRANEVYRIEGRIRSAGPLQEDGTIARVYDSLAGPQLGFESGRTDDWTSFSFLHAATDDRELTVTIELTAVGNVWIDDLRVTSVALPHATRPTLSR